MNQATTSELRIPAAPNYVIVAKRAAAAFGYIAGFGVEAVDELCIAVAQACENAIRCVAASGSDGPAQIRLGFRLEGQRLDVQVRSTCARPVDQSLGAGAAVPSAGRGAVAAPVASPLDGDGPPALALDEAARVHDLALRVMGLFVDDCQYRVDRRTGGLRVRLTKYRVQ